MEDKRLLRLIKKARYGDKEAFCEIIKEKSRKILLIATSIMGNSSDGEDAAQEAVITLARRIGTLKKAELFDAWMYRIIFNVCMDEKRRQSRTLDKSGELEYAMETVADTHSDVLPEQSVLQASDKEALLAALNELPERYRMCMLLFYYENMSYAEIADTMNVSEQVIANTLNRAKEKMRVILGEEKADKYGFAQEIEVFEKSNLAYKAGAFLPAVALSQAFTMQEAVVATPSALDGLAAAAAGAVFPAGLAFTQFIESATTKVVGTLAASALVVGAYAGVILPNTGQSDPTAEPVALVENVDNSGETVKKKTHSAEVVGLPDGAVLTTLREGYEDSELYEFKSQVADYTFVTSIMSDGSIYTLYQSEIDPNQYVLVTEDE